MTGNIVFRTKQEVKTSEGKLPQGKETTVSGESRVEVPYLDYEKEYGRPHTVDYFKLGDSWNDPMGGFSKEVALIEEYLQNKVEKGEIANSINAIKEELKKMEKITNLAKEERPLVKIETLAAYVKFLMETDKIKFNLAKYSRR